MTLTRKLEVMRKSGTCIGHDNCGHSFVHVVLKLIKNGSLKQINLPEAMFEEPCGQAFVGGTHGKNGTPYIDMFWYTTFRDCVSWKIVDDILRVTIYEGDDYDGSCLEKRDTWKFKMSSHVILETAIKNRIEFIWGCYVDLIYEAKERQRIEEAKEKLELELLGTEE